MRAWPVAISIVLAACRDRAPPVADAGPPEGTAAPLASSAALARPDPKPEAGALVNPACDGMNLSLFALDCDVPAAEWEATPAPQGLVQEAKPEGRDIVFAIVNRSSKPALVPLRFDDRHPGRSFSVIAEVDAGIYELASPRVVVDAGDGGAHLHSTRIRLPPGGRASARLAIDLAIVERLDKRGADAGRAPLAGTFTLHVGQLFSGVEMGDPARVIYRAGPARDR